MPLPSALPASERWLRNAVRSSWTLLRTLWSIVRAKAVRPARAPASHRRITGRAGAVRRMSESCTAAWAASGRAERARPWRTESESRTDLRIGELARRRIAHDPPRRAAWGVVSDAPPCRFADPQVGPALALRPPRPRPLRAPARRPGRGARFTHPAHRAGPAGDPPVGGRRPGGPHRLCPDDRPERA